MNRCCRCSTAAFGTPRFVPERTKFGIQVLDVRAGSAVAVFESNSEEDQRRFVTDLHEAIAEMAEMDRVTSKSSCETMC
jgi:hypothetical protein